MQFLFERKKGCSGKRKHFFFSCLWKCCLSRKTWRHLQVEVTWTVVHCRHFCPSQRVCLFARRRCACLCVCVLQRLVKKWWQSSAGFPGSLINISTWRFRSWTRKTAFQYGKSQNRHPARRFVSYKGLKLRHFDFLWELSLKGGRVECAEVAAFIHLQWKHVWCGYCGPQTVVVTVKSVKD